MCEVLGEYVGHTNDQLQRYEDGVVRQCKSENGGFVRHEVSLILQFFIVLSDKRKTECLFRSLQFTVCRTNNRNQLIQKERHVRQKEG